MCGGATQRHTVMFSVQNLPNTHSSEKRRGWLFAWYCARPPTAARSDTLNCVATSRRYEPRKMRPRRMLCVPNGSDARGTTKRFGASSARFASAGMYMRSTSESSPLLERIRRATSRGSRKSITSIRKSSDCDTCVRGVCSARASATACESRFARASDAQNEPCTASEWLRLRRCERVIACAGRGYVYIYINIYTYIHIYTYT